MEWNNKRKEDLEADSILQANIVDRKSFGITILIGKFVGGESDRRLVRFEQERPHSKGMKQVGPTLHECVEVHFIWSVLGPYVNDNKTCSVITYSIVNSLKWLLQLKSDSLSIISWVLTFFYWLE